MNWQKVGVSLALASLVAAKIFAPEEEAPEQPVPQTVERLRCVPVVDTKGNVLIPEVEFFAFQIAEPKKMIVTPCTIFVDGFEFR